MKSCIALVCINLWFVISVVAQMNDNELRQQVLKQGKIDSMIVFGKWTVGGQEETHLTYLGQWTTNNGKTFKLINSVWYWGQSKRATSRILIFNYNNQYVGNYMMTTVDELPSKLQNGILIFPNLYNDCDKKLITKINLSKGLPKQFFRKCKGTYGSFFVFE